MDYPHYELEELIAHLKEFMREQGLREAIVFGSRVKAEHLHRSDLDVIFIDGRFRGVPFLDRLVPLTRHWPPDLPELEVFPYTPEEFAKGNTVIREARRYGIRVVAEEVAVAGGRTP
jgi:predicted nucleotidyltransferase